jgi:nitrous oxide reductase accessory protein NosL
MAVAVAALAAALALGGCAAPAGPPAIKLGRECDACGMKVQDLRFASERQVGRAWKVYDAIECLIGDTRTTPGGAVYLPDYDGRTLHPADSMWVLKGDFPSPMGGGFAAFLDSAAANRVAAETHGRVDRLEAFMAAAAEAPDVTPADTAAAGPGS